MQLNNCTRVTTENSLRKWVADSWCRASKRKCCQQLSLQRNYQICQWSTCLTVSTFRCSAPAVWKSLPRSLHLERTCKHEIVIKSPIQTVTAGAGDAVLVNGRPPLAVIMSPRHTHRFITYYLTHWITTTPITNYYTSTIHTQASTTYYLTIRKCKTDEDNIIQEQLADCIVKNKDRNFWKEIKRIRSNKSCMSSIVDGDTDAQSTAKLAATKYISTCIQACHIIIR